jgi:hypothetical protein
MDWNICLERAPGIEIREAPDGLVVYDAGRDRLHYLNPTAALLLESCDGTLPAIELPGAETLAPGDVGIRAKRALAEGRANDAAGPH